MPIHCPVTVVPLSADEFELVDYRVMGHAYATQNALGRLCDEYAYKADLKARLVQDGFRSVLTEVPVTVSHRDFIRKYFLDLLVENALYEAKARATLTGEDDTQLLNYMFLLGVQRGKLLNFRASKVQGKIVATSLTQGQRRRVELVTRRWKDLTPACGVLRETLADLLADWGAFLGVTLYEEALVHFLGGESNIERRVSLKRNNVDLGAQRMLVHAPGVAFRLTAVTGDQGWVESHLRRLLALTELDAIQWINLNHAQIEITTIRSKAEARMEGNYAY